MAETKRVNDTYKITTPQLIIDGNLTVTGSTINVESADTQITDNFITLNFGETGAGVSTLGTTSGIEIDRGSLPAVGIRWNETTDTWEQTSNGSTWYEIVSSAPGSDTQVIYNQSGAFASEASFTYNYSTNILSVDSINTGSIVTSSDGDLTLDPNGTGKIVLSAATQFVNSSQPSAVAGSTIIYANTPNTAGTGVYFINTTTSDELVSRAKALTWALIM